MKINLYIHFSINRFIVLLLISLTLILISACADKTESKQKYFDRGMELFNQGNFTKARLEFKNVLQIDPKDANAYYMFGQIEEKDENWSKAYALHLRATELDPMHVDAQVHLGTIFALAGENEKALTAADAALNVKPNDPSAMVIKGFIKAKMGETDAAIDDVLGVIETDPANVEAASLLASLYADQGDLARAIRIAKDSLAQHADRAASYLLLARLYAQAGKHDAVVSLLSDLIRTKPDELENRLHLVTYRQQQGENGQALQVLQQAITDLPDNLDAKLALIALHKSQGAMDRAEAILEQYAGEASENTKLKLELARHYLADGRKVEADKTLSQVIELADRSTDGLAARTMKAGAMIKERALDDAAVLLEEVLETDPKYKDALFVRAGLALVSDDPDKGIADLRTLLREDPSYVKAYRLKARAHLKKGETALAKQSLEDAIKIRPEEAAANFELVQLLINTREFDGAVGILQKMRRFAPDDIKVLQSLTLVQEKNKRWDEVANLAELLISKHPESPVGYYYRGVSQLNRNMASSSITDFEKVLEMKPNSIEALIGLAKGLFVLKKPDDALQRIEKVVEANPEHFAALNLKGEVLLSQKQWDFAEEAFKKALILRPEWSVPYRNLVNLTTLKGDQEGVLELLEEGFEKTGDPVLGVDLANHYSRIDRKKDAIKVYEGILEKYPKHLLASNNLAMLLLEDDTNQDGMDKALQLVEGFGLSENPIILDTLGWVRIRRGEIDKAIPVLQRAARKGSGLPDIDYHLGVAYYQRGEIENAKRHIKAALSVEKSFEGIEEAKALLNKIQ
ncbi:MAG: tetratricopeptide repeat protein [Candidatus Thiodiazotropha endolucinida]|nr:tetratricopeptide repeat protein [Candidatus Thiodiazotropha endolucinida]